MSIAVFLKNNLRNIPPVLGVAISHYPYSLRPGIGRIYRQRKSEIENLSLASLQEKQNFVFERMQEIVVFAYNNIKFYKEFYDSRDFSPNDLRTFSDIAKIPVITKSILNQYNIEDRSFPSKGRYIVNTGGTSGSPFSFYIEPSSMGHEWAHMHTIWNKLGYRPSDLKIVFGGRSDVKSLVEYDVVRNHFALDIYANYKSVVKQLKKIIRQYNIKYLHGYPSSIYDFTLYCEKEDPELLQLLKNKLLGAFLGSEYPHTRYREKIESVFDIKTISWYGHTERAVLAYEKEEPFKYEPFLTYGYSEINENQDGEFHLISTSYYNFASPLIRYNTEDTVEEPIIENGILVSFKILKGREGEFVIDKAGKKINLTGLIFGRHHQLFNFADFIQVKQKRKGMVEILFVANEKITNPAALFDSDNLDFDVVFTQVDEPIKTISGKVNLLVK